MLAKTPGRGHPPTHKKIRKMPGKRKAKGAFNRAAAVFALAFAWAFIFLTPPEFSAWVSGKKMTLEEQRYLSELRRKYSGTQRTLTVGDARRAIAGACAFISRANGSPGLYDTPEARELLFGTACTESGLRPRFQDSHGFAIGLFQIEYATFCDLRDRALKSARPGLYAEIVRAYAKPGAGDITFEDLQQNDELAAVFARLKYAQTKDPIPPADDVNALARYYKKHYNTHLGKATPQAYVKRRAEALEGG